MVRIEKLQRAIEFFCKILEIQTIPVFFREERKFDGQTEIFAQILAHGSKPQAIEIFNINGRSEDSIIYSGAHELKHAEQILNKRLAPTLGGNYWNGKLDNSPYHRQPWEVEANGFASKACIEFNRFLRG